MTVRRDLTITPISPPGVSLVVGLGDGAAVPSGGVGGWATVARPKRRAMTEYQGTDPFTLAVPVLFDAFPNGTVEPQIVHLAILASPWGAQPPVLKLRGPVPGTTGLWVINGIDWGALERRDSDGAICRQAATVTFLEFVAGDVMVESKKSPAERAAARAPAPPAAAPGAAPQRSYTVVRGDTLSGISAKMLGSAARWKEIADLNGVRDPRRLQVGQVLRLP